MVDASDPNVWARRTLTCSFNDFVSMLLAARFSTVPSRPMAVVRDELGRHWREEWYRQKSQERPDKGSEVGPTPGGGVRVEMPTGAQNVGQFGFASAIYQPAEVLAKKIGTPQESACRPYNIQDEIEALNLRIVALERAVWRS